VSKVGDALVVTMSIQRLGKERTMSIPLKGRKKLPLSLILTGLLLLSINAMAVGTFEPVFNPTLALEKSSGMFKIDGNLTDSAWKTASRITNFVERDPGDNTKPEVETEVMITHDEDRLYAAFLCYDDPTELRTTMCQRDQFNGDDAVVLLIDTFGDATWAYEFFVNPYGIQKDMLWTSGGMTDIGFDLIWESAAKITDSGYQVEVAIPFASLRFPNKESQSWRMDFWRNRPRNSFMQYSWAANDRNEQCWPCKWGTVEGIRNFRPGKGLEILPTIIANQTGTLRNYGPDESFDNTDLEGELSLGGKYSVSSDLILEAAYNPDFSQIEADADQIDVNTTIALSYPERRPYFQEGSDIFRTLFQSFYTRTVNDPKYTAKLTGRMSGTTLGFLSAYDENSPYIIPLEERSILRNSGKSLVNVLRGSKSFGNNSFVGLMVTDRRWDGGGSGSILSLDGDIRLSQNYSVVGQFVLSHTDEPKREELTSGLTDNFDNGRYTAALDGESYYGGAFITQFRRRARHLNFTIGYNQVDPTYRTQTGYDPWNNQRNFSFTTRYQFYPENSFIQRFTPWSYTEFRWNFDDVKKWGNSILGCDASFKLAQTHLSASYKFIADETWEGVTYNGTKGFQIDIDSRPLDQLGAGIYLWHGKGVARYNKVKAKETSFSAYLNLKPIDRLIIEPNINYARSENDNTGEEIYEGYITRTRFRYQANKQLSFRLVVQYNDFAEAWDIDPLMTYRISPFSVFYFGSTYDYGNLALDQNSPSQWKLTSRQFFMKLQYLFQT
jgi:hypothetical protein